jgi:hypothetical protein
VSVDLYTDEECALIRKLRDVDRLPWQQIADRMGRGNSGTAVRAKYIKLIEEPEPAPTTKPRKCLRCTLTFQSSGPGNRMCDDCRGREASPFEPDAVGGFDSRRVITGQPDGAPNHAREGRRTSVADIHLFDTMGLIRTRRG